VKVGHRQTPYKQKAPPDMVGLFALLSDASVSSGLCRIKIRLVYNLPVVLSGGRHE
jgi:hypothetical protein